MDSPPSPKVSLPSIHEMFPEHLMTKKSQSQRHGSPPSSASSPSSRYRPVPQPDSSSSSPAMPPSPHHHDRASPGPSRTQQPADGRPMEVVSFDVLRSDPASSSLQHLGSSNTLPSRGGNIGFHPNQAGVDRGTAPAFRVSVKPGSTPPPPPPSDASSSSSSSSSPTSRQQQQPHSGYQPPHPSDNNAKNDDDDGMYIKDAPPRSGSSASGHPAIISFPVSASGAGGSSNTEIIPDDPGNASEGDDGMNDGPTSGKKHVCPTCLKRFNRPSSLRIHVNTHTGATPFRCPWPNCGREFNVNSNMRRHYRNHTTPGFSRQPNDNRRRRRRLEPSASSSPSLSGLPPHLPGSDTGGVPTLRRVPPDGFMHPHRHPHTGGYIGSDDSDGGYESASDYGGGRKGYEDEDEYAYARPRSSRNSEAGGMPS